MRHKYQMHESYLNSSNFMAPVLSFLYNAHEPSEPTLKYLTLAINRHKNSEGSMTARLVYLLDSDIGITMSHYSIYFWVQIQLISIRWLGIYWPHNDPSKQIPASALSNKTHPTYWPTCRQAFRLLSNGRAMSAFAFQRGDVRGHIWAASNISEYILV